MIGKIILTALFTLFLCDAQSQHTRVTELKPIHQEGRWYYYDFKKIDGGAYALQIPLQSLDDAEINRRYKTFRTLSSFGRVLVFVPIVYLLTLPKNNGYTYLSPNDFWIIFGTTLAAQLAFEIVAKSHLKKGIDRYNTLILQPSGNSLGAALTYKF